MIISDLEFLEIPEETTKLIGSFAVVNVGSYASAFGSLTLSAASANSWAISTPYGGSIALGYAQAIGIAYTPPTRW